MSNDQFAAAGLFAPDAADAAWALHRPGLLFGGVMEWTLLFVLLYVVLGLMVVGLVAAIAALVTFGWEVWGPRLRAWTVRVRASYWWRSR